MKGMGMDETIKVKRAIRNSQYSYKTAFSLWWIVNQRLPNPDEILQKRGQSVLIYRSLTSDSHLGAVLESRSSATLANEWTLERGEAPQRLFTAIDEWFRQILERKQVTDDLSRDELLENILEVTYYGYQPIELTWDYLGGLWMPMSIVPKPQEWFTWFITEDGNPELRFLSAQNPVDGEPPPDDFTLMCPRIPPTYTNPYGRGVAQRVFWPIIFKKAGIEFWMNFLERFGTPWVLGKIDSQTASEEDLAAFRTQLENLVQDAVIAVSGTRTVEILEQKSQRSSNSGFADACNFFDSQISKTVLGHTLTTDASDKSSYAATRGALTVRDDIIKRDTRMIRSVFNDIVNLIYVRNGYLSKPRPTVKAHFSEDPDTDRARRDEALSRTGVRFSKKYYIRTYRLQEDDIDSVDDPSKLQSSSLEKVNRKLDKKQGKDRQDTGEEDDDE